MSLILSHFPERITTLLSWLGIDCDRDTSIKIIEFQCDHGAGVTSSFAKICLGLYECIVVPVFGVRTSNVDKVLEFVENELNLCDKVTRIELVN